MSIEANPSEQIPLKSPQALPSEPTMASIIIRFLISFAVVAGVALSWACATQFSKSVMVYDVDKFYAPYTLVWFSTCFMTICYPVYVVYALIKEHRTLKEINTEALNVFGKNKFTFKSLILNVTPFLVLWMGANYCYSVSLKSITASAASSIMSSNVAMVCLLSWILLHEPFDVLRILAVIASVVGVVVISLDSEFTGDLLGVLLVVASAAFAAVYKVVFKKLMGNASLGQVSLFMTYLGLLNTTINIIPAAVLIITKIDHIDFAYVPWGPLIGSALLGLAFNFLVNFGIALLNPLIISIGMLCGIPVSTIIDIVFRDIPLTVKFTIGSLLILFSFVLCAFPLREMYQKVTKRSKTSYDVTTQS